MKPIHLLRRAVILTSAIVISSFDTAKADPIKILPMGDSITFGVGGTAELGGYRGPLYTLLENAGYEVDYVGTSTENGASLADPDHEGHSGWRIDQLDSNVAGWFDAIDTPDFILLHIGTNDFGQNLNTSTAIDRLDALITKMSDLRPTAHIIVTNLMERNEPQNSAIQAQFNPFVEGVVNDHINAGDLVSFLDMRAAVPLSDMPDNLHPNQTGYNKMAAAWVTAIEEAIEPGDEVPPAIVSARGSESGTQITVTFNKRLEETAAENTSNYTSSGGVTISAAELSPTLRTVTLTTSEQTIDQVYTLTVNNLTDLVSPTPNTIATNSTADYFRATSRGYFNHVEESDCYTLVYSLDIPNSPDYGNTPVLYDIDYRNRVGTFDRVAYYMELQSPGGDLQYAWISMDSFASSAAEIGVPTLASGATFQESVGNLNVISNVPGISSTSGNTGNLEFWPTNYDTPSSAAVPGASDTAYDIGDTPTPGNYGSMQIHDTTTGETLLSFSGWGGAGGPASIGIGTNPAPSNNDPDWTFAQNASGYSIKTLQILVQTTGDLIAPIPDTAVSSFARTGITLRFSEPVRRETLVAGNFSLDEGVTILAATPQEDQHEVFLETTVQPDGVPLTLTINNVRDTSPNANQITANSTIAVTAPALPPTVVSHVGAAADGYQLVYSVDIPAIGNFNSTNPYIVDNTAASGTFSRVAYYLELEHSGGAVNYVWAAMDAFTLDRSALGIPTFASGNIFQQSVANLDVISDMPGVVNGTGITGGNIEFWPTNYAEGNANGVPGASGSTFDFGDSRNGDGDYGSMQIHNSSSSQTLFAINNWGLDGRPICLGIGNQSTGSPDWTFAENAGSYTRRVLHIMVLPTPAPPVPAEVLANVPEASDYELVYSLDLPGQGNLVGGSGFAPYTVNLSNEVSSFSRVAYYLELQKTGDPSPTYVWASMDAFTADRGQTGVPTPASGSVFQQSVTNMNVVSNSPAVTTGTGLTGNLEFWPTNYETTNSAAVPGASGATFDFGDTPTPGDYGSMQIHSTGHAQTLFAINKWGTAGSTTNNLCIGIGNNPSGSPDWTFAENSSTYDLKRTLHILVLPGESPVGGPLVVSATGSSNLDRLIVRFDRKIAETSIDPANFLIDGGLTVTSARLLSDGKQVALTTTPQTSGTLYNVSVSGIRERSPSGTEIQSGAGTSFTAYTEPAILANVPETSGYQLIQQLAIPSASPRWNFNEIPYSIDESKYGPLLFDRVAYLMELDGEWVYASFDAFTNSITKIGVPNASATDVPFQQIVSNMNVASNSVGITTGDGITTGNIEFWGGNYQQPNSAGIPGADGATYDFGDTMTPGGHGSMQIHNHGAGQTIFAYNNWGANAGQISELGIGNNPGVGDPDWTFSDSASNYTTRNLYVLARLGGSASGPAPVIYTQPCDRAAALGSDVTFAVTIDTSAGDGPFTYQWRLDGVPINGATLPWLELTGITAGEFGSYDVIITGPNFVSTTSSSAVLSLIGENLPPTFDGYSFSIQKDGSIDIPTATILAKASDPNTDPLTISNVGDPSAEDGSVTLAGSTITYQTPPGFIGSDSFTVTIDDSSGGIVMGTVNVTVTNQSVDLAGDSAITILLPGSEVETIFRATPGEDYGLQRSLDLLDWDVIRSGTAGDDGIIVFIDSTPPSGEPKVFYRTINPVPAP